MNSWVPGRLHVPQEPGVLEEAICVAGAGYIK